MPSNLEPIVTETVTGTTAQMRHLAHNPNTIAITDIERVGVDTVMMTIQRRVPVKVVKPRIPFTLQWAPGAYRAFAVGACIVGTIAGLILTGWMIWLLWGDEITAGLKILAVVTLIAAAAGTVVLAATAKNGHLHCPGIHCPGCKGGH